MPFDLGQFGMQAATTAMNTGLGLLLEGHNDRRQLRQQGKLGEQQLQFNQRALDYSNEKQLEMWEKTNYKAQKEQMKKAGLNPALLYGMGGGGGATTGGGSVAGVSGGNAPSGGGEIMGLMGMRAQMQLLNAQKENIEADTEQKRATTEKTSGVDTDLARANVDNAKLDGIIKEVTGTDMKNKWEQVTFPNRGIEADTHQKELEARGAVAQNVWELWSEGKLKQKSNEEIESIVLSNAKSREERKNIMKTFELLEETLKGKRLENVILELEAKLQSETGIDKSSAGWLKILGRLFIGAGGRELLK